MLVRQKLLSGGTVPGIVFYFCYFGNNYFERNFSSKVFFILCFSCSIFNIFMSVPTSYPHGRGDEVVSVRQKLLSGGTV